MWGRRCVVFVFFFPFSQLLIFLIGSFALAFKNGNNEIIKVGNMKRSTNNAAPR